VLLVYLSYFVVLLLYMWLPLYGVIKIFKINMDKSEQYKH